MIYLDTHIASWLFSDPANRLGSKVRKLLAEHDIIISPIVALELEYLYETGRASASGTAVVAYLAQRIGLQVCDQPFEHVIQAAAEQRWTRDPFDRIIVGHAALTQRMLVTKDREIRANYARAFWEDG